MNACFLTQAGLQRQKRYYNTWKEKGGTTRYAKKNLANLKSFPKRHFGIAPANMKILTH